MENMQYVDDMVDMAHEMIALLRDNDLFYETCIYAGGDRYTPDETAPEGYAVEQDIDAHDYFTWAPRDGHLFSMSFEGPLNHILNWYVGGYDSFRDDFDALFTKYGVYYEFGDAWNLTCYRE